MRLNLLIIIAVTVYKENIVKFLKNREEKLNK